MIPEDTGGPFPTPGTVVSPENTGHASTRRGFLMRIRAIMDGSPPCHSGQPGFAHRKPRTQQRDGQVALDDPGRQRSAR